MRLSEKKIMDPELSTRYILDEARFTGGREDLRSKEAKQ